MNERSAFHHDVEKMGLRTGTADEVVEPTACASAHEEVSVRVLIPHVEMIPVLKLRIHEVSTFSLWTNLLIGHKRSFTVCLQR